MGRGTALVASAVLVAASFLPWDAEGSTALEVGLLSLGERSEQPTVALALVALAALGALPALVSAAGLPRFVAGTLTAALLLAWLAFGPDGALTGGVLAALVAAILHLVAAAVATGGDLGEASATPRDADARTDDPVGFAHLDHTADSAFRAWGRTRAECFSAAVRALVDSFADPGGATERGTHTFTIVPADEEDLLVDLLSEVIYLLEVRRSVPIGGELRPTSAGGLEGAFDLVPVDEVTLTGAIPKAVTYHALAVRETPDGGWQCRVTIDV